MKYLLIILASCMFLFAQPTVAAKVVKGTVPKVQPLQPPAAGIFPNVQGNVQYHDISRDAPTGSPDSINPSLQNSSVPDGQNNPSTQKNGYAGNSRLIWVLIFFAILIVGGWWLIKRNNNE